VTQPHSHSAATLKALQPFGYQSPVVITMSNSPKALLAKSASPQSVEPERSFSDASNIANAAAIVSPKSERCQNGKPRSFCSHAYTYLNYAFTGLDGPAPFPHIASLKALAYDVCNRAHILPSLASGSFGALASVRHNFTLLTRHARRHVDGLLLISKFDETTADTKW